MRALNAPNLLSLIRFFGAPLIPYAFFASWNPLWFIPNTDYRVGAFILAVFLALTDLFDGASAKWLKQETLLGKRLDPIADFSYCCSLSASVLLVYVDYPVLYWATMFFTCYFVLYGITAIRLRRKNKIESPDKKAKWGMCALMTSMLCVIAGTFMWPPFVWHISAFVLAWISASWTWEALEEYRKPTRCANCPCSKCES